MRMGGFCRRVRRRRCWGWCGEWTGFGLGFCVCGLLALALGGSEGLEWGIGFGYGYGYGVLDSMKIRYYGCGLEGPAIPVYGLILFSDLRCGTTVLMSRCLGSRRSRTNDFFLNRLIPYIHFPPPPPLPA